MIEWEGSIFMPYITIGGFGGESRLDRGYSLRGDYVWMVSVLCFRLLFLRG